MTKNSDEVQMVHERIDQLEADNSRLEAENAELDDRIVELEAQVNSDQLLELQSENDRLESENAALDDRVEELEAHFEASTDPGSQGLKIDIDRLEAENSELQVRIEELQLGIEEQGAVAKASLGSDEEPLYVASKNRNKFHRPGCKWAEFIPDHQLIEFGSHREAVDAGFKPCGTCRA